MQDRLGHADSHSQYSHTSTADYDATASTAALTERLDRLGIGQIGNANVSSGKPINGSSANNGNAAASAGHTSLSSKAAAALIEDNDFDDSIEELNHDLPPHACR